MKNKHIKVNIPQSSTLYPEYDWKTKLEEITGISYLKVTVSKINYEYVLLEAIDSNLEVVSIQLDYIALIFPTLISKK